MSGTGTYTAIKPAEPPEATAGGARRFATGSRWAHREAGPDRTGATVPTRLTGVPIQTPRLGPP
jgi:hypothetical protein